MTVYEVIDNVLGAYLAFFWIFFGFLYFYIKRKIGFSPISKKKIGVYGFVDNIVLSAYLLNTSFYFYGTFSEIELFGLLDIGELKIFGFALVSISFIGWLVSQLQMGSNWRVGLNKKNTTKIVESGLFRYFRHPIYLFINLIGFGIFLVYPWFGSLSAFLIIWLGLSVEARIEEEFLLQKHGKKYQNFMNKRKRWF